MSAGFQPTFDFEAANEAAEDGAALVIDIDGYEGPLHVLLALARSQKVDLLQLSITRLAEQYLAFVQQARRVRFALAADYLVMAAWLAYLKSRLLLPKPERAKAEEPPAEEMAAQLAFRLAKLDVMRKAVEALKERPILQRDVFTRGMEAPEAMGPAPLASIGLFKLLDAFQAVLKRANQELAFEITAEGVSIQDRMAVLTERLRGRRHCSFDELFEDVRSVYEVVVTFLAILEMAKRRLTRIYQADVLAPIHLELLVTEVDESMVSGVDEYDGRGPQAVAPSDDEALDESVARPGEDPLGEALDPEEEGLHDAPPAAPPEVDATDEPQDDEE